MGKSGLQPYQNRYYMHPKYGRVLVIKHKTEYHLQCPVSGCTYHRRESKYDVNHQHSIVSSNISQYYPTSKTPAQTLKNMIAQFTAESNLPSNFVQKYCFTSFVNSISQYAFQFSRNNPKTTSFPQISSLNASENTKTIKLLNEKQNTKILSLFKHKYVSLIFDAGTVKKLHTLEFLISNVDLQPYLYESIQISEFATHEVYKSEILKVINDLIKQEIIPIGLVADNLRAQKMVINHKLRTSIQQESFTKNLEISDEKLKLISAIVNVPCSNHVLNLAMTDIFSKIIFFQQINNIINFFSSISKNKVIRKYIKETKKSTFYFNMCSTRWFYIVDVIKYLFRKKSLIDSLNNSNDINIKSIMDELDIENLNQWDENLKVALILLEPIKILSLKLESNTSTLSNVKPWLSEFNVEMNKRGKEINEQELVSDMLQIIFNRFMDTSNFELIISSFFLSFLGKYYIMYYKTNKSDLYNRDHCYTDDSQEIVDCINQLQKDKKIHIKYEGLNFPSTIDNLDHILNQNENNQSEDSEEENEIELKLTDDEELLNLKEQLTQLNHLLTKSIPKIQFINQIDISNIQEDIHRNKDIVLLLYKNLLQSLSSNTEQLTDSYISIFSKYFQSYLEYSLTISPIEDLEIQEKAIENLKTFLSSIKTNINNMTQAYEKVKQFLSSFPQQYIFSVSNDDTKDISNELFEIQTLINNFSQSLICFETTVSAIISIYNHSPWYKVYSIIHNDSPIVLTEYCVKQMSKLLNLNIETVLKQLNLWWEMDFELDIHEHDIYSAQKYWSSMESNQQFSALSQIIPRFVYLSASEASAERIFSSRKNLLTDHFSNVTNDYVKSRLQIQTGKNILQMTKDMIDIDKIEE